LGSIENIVMIVIRTYQISKRNAELLEIFGLEYGG
jgi:hypothetical protein